MIGIYPVTDTEIKVCNYRVKINGREVRLNTARVSAVPFNRRWPGHQRGKEQTELINFLSLASDEVLNFEIIPEAPFESAVVKPLSLGIAPQISDGVIRFSLGKPAYFTVEPYGRANALHIFVDPIKNYKADIKDSGLIYFGAGEHDVGEIRLESNQTLFIDEGAVVYACVNVKDAENIKIIGNGILDNSKNSEEILYEYNAENNASAINNAVRRHTVQLEYCTGIEIDGITIRDSLVYNIRPIGCKNLHISNVKIIGCWRYNSDGIDMHNCENVLIENCFIRTFDDSVCVKGFDCYYDGDVEEAVKKAMYRNGKAYDVFKNAVIRNCVIWNDWGKCLEIGAETRAEEICDISFCDCDIIHVSGTPLDVCNIDYADVHDISYKNINVEYDGIIMKPLLQAADAESYVNTDEEYAPWLICVETSYHHEYSAGGTRRGRSHGICFEDIRLFGRHKPSGYFVGYDGEHKTGDVLIKNIAYNGEKITDFSNFNFTRDKFTENIRFE